MDRTKDEAGRSGVYYMIERPAATNGFAQPVWARLSGESVVSRVTWTPNAADATHFINRGDAESRAVSLSAWDVLVTEHMDSERS